MKVTICGSMSFANHMLEAQKKLEQLGHEVFIATDTHQIVNGEVDHDDLDADYEHVLENDVMKDHFRFIDQSDAILVINHEKNDIPGYIGASTLMEIGVAYHLDKKIYLLYALPHHNEQRWAHEVRITQPIVLNGDLQNFA